MSNPYALVKCVTDALKAHIRMYESHCAVRETGNIHTRPQRWCHALFVISSTTHIMEDTFAFAFL